jgi:hypothetical protein
MGRTARTTYPDGVISLSARAREDDAVQILTSSRSTRPPLGAVFIGLAVGTMLLAGGLFLGWVAFATPVLTGLTPSTGRPGAGQMALGAAIWAFTLVAPASFAIIGALRIGRVARAVSAKPQVRVLGRLAGSIGDEYLSAVDVRLPDGRILRDLVLGPFGMAVISELPPAQVTRHSGSNWEIHRPNGRWEHFENPLERATRDAERVRRWVASAERDFVVKVYAAVVTSDPTVTRTPTCAVLSADQIPSWLATLPPSRAMSEDRRSELAEELRELL